MSAVKTRMRGQYFLLTLLSLAVSVASSRPQFYPGEVSPSSTPYFSSVAKKYTAQVGSGVILNCKVENIGSSTLVWKKDGRMISAGSILIRKDFRMALRGQSLEITGITEEDGGEYICEVETFGAPIDQVHSLEVLVPPTIRAQPADGRFVVRKGSTITLECNAKGNPQPVITWTRENNMLPSGEKSVAGSSIVLADVSRHHAGLYLCTAENGVGEPAEARIELQVLYPPEIEVDQTWIKSRDGIEAEVSCNVHAEPVAEVKWYKETMLLDPTNSRHMETYGNRHVLILRNVNEQDFGNYSCMADNSLGRDRKTTEVSGRPHPAKVTSPPLSSAKDQYNLTWTVDSFLKVAEYRILYRVILKSATESHSPGKHTEWTNIIPTIGNRDLQTTTGSGSSSTTSSFTYLGTFNFFGLEANTEYEVIIQSRNREGWSDPSQIFRFSTRPANFDPRELELQKSTRQSSSFLSSSCISHNSWSAALITATVLVTSILSI